MGAEVSQAKARIKTGTYTGDGNATQVIIGVGFQPTALWVYKHTDGGYYWNKNNQMGLYTKRNDSGYHVNAIISLDADGFTVGNIGAINTLNDVYSYVALRD